MGGGGGGWWWWWWWWQLKRCASSKSRGSLESDLKSLLFEKNCGLKGTSHTLSQKKYQKQKRAFWKFLFLNKTSPYMPKWYFQAPFFNYLSPLFSTDNSKRAFFAFKYRYWYWWYIKYIFHVPTLICDLDFCVPRVVLNSIAIFSCTRVGWSKRVVVGGGNKCVT